jgi:hypothetical protein
MDDIELPPLPPTDWRLLMPATRYEPGWPSHQDGYADTDMRDYARAAILADRERLRTLCVCGEPLALNTVHRNERGDIVAATLQDKNGRILSVIAEAQPAPSAEPVKGVVWMNGGASLVNDGSEEFWQLRRGATRLYLAPQPAPSAEAVAWQWLQTGHFRKSRPPTTAEPCAWRPLYAAPQPALPPEAAQAMREALDALEVGYDSAKAEADQYHEAMAGYRPHRHAAMDADVQTIASAMTALRAVLDGETKR